jgi:hypothetical protein
VEKTRNKKRGITSAFLRGQGKAGKAKQRGKLRGKAVPVMLYPRPATKALLVFWSKKLKESMSGFATKGALERCASLAGKNVPDIIPDVEYQELYRPLQSK